MASRPSSRPRVVATASFDDLRYRHVRFLEEAFRLGDVCALVWPDEMVRRITGHAPQFPQEERLYLVSAIRYVSECRLLDERLDPDLLPEGVAADIWAMEPGSLNTARKTFCRSRRIDGQVISEAQLVAEPEQAPLAQPSSDRSKVIVTGCYDWLHSGHVRFFEEASAYGDLYVGVGHDSNIRLLKGERHPMFPEQVRRYLVASIRHVTTAFVTSGNGWLDAAPEIAILKPAIYLTNEDGDNEQKRSFCREHGLRYVVLKRVPRQGLPARSSTALRSF